MKKVLALIMALVLVLSLAACGDGSEENTETSSKIPKEEMMKSAVELDNFASAYAENKLRAEEKYIGNVYLVTGSVGEIENDHIELHVDRNYNKRMIVDLPTDDIKNLDVGQQITVVGKFESLSSEETYNTTYYKGNLTNSYLVKDRFELSGKLLFYYMDLITIDKKTVHRYGEADAWVIGLDLTDDNVHSVECSFSSAIPVNHVKGQNIDSITISGTKLKSGTKITVSGKFYGGSMSDIELISVDK